MTYVFLVYQEEAMTHAAGEGPCDGVAREALDFREWLRQSGHLLASSALQTGRSAMNVRVRHGRAAIADGPATRTKQQLAAVWLIEARDLNEALRLAARMPEARVGTIEVRPLREENER